MGQFNEWIVYTGKASFKTFTNKDKAIKFATKNDKEVWEDTCTTCGLIVDSIKIYSTTKE